MHLEPVTQIDQIKQGDRLLMVDGNGEIRSGIAKIVKVTEYDGTEVIYNVKKNQFFNVGLYLEGKSWVKECAIVRAAGPEKACEHCDSDKPFWHTPGCESPTRTIGVMPLFLHDRAPEPIHTPKGFYENPLQSVADEMREMAREMRIEDRQVGIVADNETADELDGWASRIELSASAVKRAACIKCAASNSADATVCERCGSQWLSIVPVTATPAHAPANVTGEAAKVWADGWNAGASAINSAKARQAASSPSGYEAMTPAYTRWVSPEQYARFSPGVQKWYRPYWSQQRTVSAPDRDRIGAAVSQFFAGVDNGDGSIAFDHCSSGDIDLLVDAMLAAAPEAPEPASAQNNCPSCGDVDSAGGVCGKCGDFEPKPQVERPECKTGGLLARHAICPHIITGGVHCGYSGSCVHQEGGD